MKRRWLWLGGAVAYGTFCWWYTNTGGPLGAEEQARITAAMRASGRAPDRIANIARFMAEDDGNQLIMVNALHLAESPPAVLGVPAGESAEALMARYMAYMYPAMLSRASHPVFAGRAVFQAMDVAGFEDESKVAQWTNAALVRYRSRRDLLAIAVNPEFEKRHPFKLAALEKTIAYPVATEFYLSDGRLLLALVLLPILLLLDRLFGRERDSRGAAWK